MVCLAKSCLFFLPGRDTRRIGGVTKAGHLPFLGKAFLPQAIFREIQCGIRQISYLRHIIMEEFRTVIWTLTEPYYGRPRGSGSR